MNDQHIVLNNELSAKDVDPMSHINLILRLKMNFLSAFPTKRFLGWKCRELSGDKNKTGLRKSGVHLPLKKEKFR